MSDDILDLTLAATARLIQQRHLSPVDLVKASLAKIGKYDPVLRSFISVFEEQALAISKAAEIMVSAGQLLGPLHGIPIALKDNIATRGGRTTAGGKILSDWIPEEDATIALRLRQAGAVVLGKTNMHEYAWGGTSANPHYGSVRNPWNPERFPAGSSGGSAVAVAARFCHAAIGTDTGGSIRLPSAVNGVTGLRPTHGRVSNRGIIPLAWSMDTAGPIARTAEDCALLFETIAGFDARDPTSAECSSGGYSSYLGMEIRGLRIGIVPGYFFHHIQPAVEKAVKDALQIFVDQGALLIDTHIQHIEGNISAQLTIESAEPSTYHQRELRARPNDYGEDVRTLLEVGEMLLATQYLQAQRYRALLRAEFLEAFKRVDVFICPTLPFTATKVGETKVTIAAGIEEDMLSAIMQFTGIASLTGLPALNVPCGFDAEGLPVGMQIIGKPFSEAHLFGIGHAFQMVTPFHQRAPDSRRWV